jgi:hypothetical protein
MLEKSSLDSAGKLTLLISGYFVKENKVIGIQREHIVFKMDAPPYKHKSPIPGSQALVQVCGASGV